MNDTTSSIEIAMMYSSTAGNKKALITWNVEESFLGSSSSSGLRARVFTAKERQLDFTDLMVYNNNIFQIMLGFLHQ
jgi:hypothetical protein